MSTLSIGLTALQAAQMGLDTVGHNIANVNTIGFRRQQLVLATNDPVPSGNSFIGQGVNVATISRSYNDFLERQVSQNESQFSYFDQYLQGLQQINNVMGDRTVGFSAAIQKFFKSWNDLAGNPSSVPTRQAALGAANAVADNINGLGNYLESLQGGINSQITGLVSKINSLASGIAGMNQRISAIVSSGLSPNDLLDQRDQMASDLNKLAGTTVIKDPTSGNFNIFMASGYQLVGEGSAHAISANSSPYDPTRTEVFDASGSLQLSVNSSIGGQLGAALDFRSNVLDLTQNSLGRIAMALSQSVNDQHQLGQDLNGAAGGVFFNSMTSLPQAFASSKNTSAAVVTAAVVDASQLTTSDYSLSFSAGVYTLNRLSDGQSWSNANVATLATTAAQGFSLSISAAPNAGDTFLIRPTSAATTNMGVAISDPSKIAVAAPVSASTSAANTGTAQITQPTVNTSNQPPLNANLTSTVTFTFTGAAAFDVVGAGTGNPVGVVYTSGGNITYNGWTLQISGTPAAGDVFTIGPNTGGTLDNRNALAIAALQNDKTMISGNNTLESAYTTLVAYIGNTADETSINQKAQKNLLDQAQQAQQSVSGVNLDEEAANLIHYQQSYQASAQIIKTANTLFDTLLSLGG